MTDTYRSVRQIGAYKGVKAAVAHLIAAGHLAAARDLEDHAQDVARQALTEQPRDRWSGAYSGAIARAERATRDRTRDERAASAGLDPYDD